VSRDREGEAWFVDAHVVPSLVILLVILVVFGRAVPERIAALLVAAVRWRGVRPSAPGGERYRLASWSNVEGASPMSHELRASLLAAHEAVFDDLLDAVDGLEAAAWATPTGCPGWDVKDQVAHIVALERFMLGDPHDDVVLPEGLSHVRNEIDRWMEHGVHRRRANTPAELVEEAGAVFGRRLAALARLDPDRFGEPLEGPAGLRIRTSQLLRTRVFDLTCHVDDIRRALDRPGPAGGPHRTIAVEQVLRAWARTLPAALGGDGSLGVEVAGHGRVTIDLSEGTLHREGDGPPPTASARLSSSQLLALGGGRSDAPGVDEVATGGDHALIVRWWAAATITP
jgi:uncharacterized protein (TIGR03083 family)